MHPTLVERLSGKTERLDSVERAVAGVRSSRKLTHDALTKIVDSPDFSAAQEFWTWLSPTEMQQGLAGEIDLWNLPKNEKAVIKKLRSVYKTFEAVSVVLRFVVPEQYGILSTPVEHLLGIQPAAESIDRYLNYVKNLRAVRDHRKFKTAAQVDQALWNCRSAFTAAGSKMSSTSRKSLSGIRSCAAFASRILLMRSSTRCRRWTSQNRSHRTGSTSRPTFWHWSSTAPFASMPAQEPRRMT